MLLCYRNRVLSNSLIVVGWVTMWNAANNKAGQIPPQHFVCPNVFNQEMAWLGQHTWQFMGFVRDVARPQDYLTKRIGQTSVVVQNVQGQLKAFHNVCLHRGAQIATQPTGHGALRCGYHGWVYGADGEVRHLPHNDELFGLDETTRCQQLRLPQFRVDTCGDLVFVCLSPTVPPLPDFLGSLYPILETLSLAHGEQLCQVAVETQANWKIVLENGLEELHSKFIHPDTFGKSPQVFDSTYQFHRDQLHSSLYAPINDAEADAQEARYRPYYGNPRVKLRQYQCHFAFPNFILSTSFGYVYVLHDYVPLAADRTRTVLTAFGATKGPADKPTTPTYRDQLLEGILHIQHQDKAAAEMTQAGVGEMRTPFIFGKKEERVYAFENAYRQLFIEGRPLQPSRTPTADRLCAEPARV